MPNLKRVDIMLLRHGIGLPIEVKGQWHQNVWDGSTTQPDEMYAQDWRAKGSGIHLVLWFGEGSCKNLTAHPDGTKSPTSAANIRITLEDRLTEAERSGIDVFVLDVS